MKRVLAVVFIVCYVAVLTLGNVCHVLRYKTAAHPLMYMIVWDMFCGWSAFDSRIHIVAEGESEKLYDLTHPPWGELCPYGYIGRENYDQFQTHTGTLGLNVLRHTRHEPITRVFVIEECWQKKFNLPDDIWMARYDDEKDIERYYRRRVVLLPDGTVTQLYTGWVPFQMSQMVMSNPRLVQESNQSRPLYVFDPRDRPGKEVIEPLGGSPGLPARVLPAAPSGN